ncbi:MAG TPA: hypothetical protein VJT49_12880 [Amycolatopsis sp.]|uniref:aromatic-ring hydroxylase C-terminal domain-containing protein n=1 Tax=Amycolatopsis sp. TaxID=37632 RepID=UPI002B483D2C|nr:hypothetical protein [Amycolatopsis sp.]HKS45979.1 hypothetical protein [Amycolatopsis sp.]
MDFVAAGCAEAPTEAVLIRPDGYVWCGSGGRGDGLEEALTTWFGVPATARPPATSSRG